MKKHISILLFGLSCAALQAQDISDALRLGQIKKSGTARYNAMGGAFGSLGGDLSAVSDNPAGSVIFINNQATISLGNFNKTNDSKYFSKSTSDDDNTLDVNQAGGVFVFENYDKTEWNKFALAINYQSDNLNNRIFSSGINTSNSVANYFLYYANARPGIGGIGVKYLHNGYYDELNFADQQAFLGYQTFLINPSIFIANTDLPTSNHNQYVSGVRPGGNYYHENSVVAEGYNSNLTLNVAGQYQNWLSVGLNLNFNTVDYRQKNIFFESNQNTIDANYSVSTVRFNNEIFTYGTGFSFQVGAIAKPSKDLRFGLTYQSATWYHLNDEFTQSLFTTSQKTGSTINDALDPNIINTYDPYSLRSPSKWTGSFAYVFGKIGLLSIDYSTRDFSRMKFGPANQFNNPASNNTNTDIQNALTIAREIKAGGEIKLKQWSLRGGYRFDESPYKNKDLMGNLHTYSAGLGYNWGETKLDLAYSASRREYNQAFFNAGLTDAARIATEQNIVTATLVFEF